MQRLLQLDLDLREPALELLAIALGELVLLGEALAIGLDLLELDAQVLDVGRQPHHVIGLTAAAPPPRLRLDEQAAEPPVLFLERADLRARCATRWSRPRRARP